MSPNLDLKKERKKKERKKGGREGRKKKDFQYKFVSVFINARSEPGRGPRCG